MKQILNSEARCGKRKLEPGKKGELSMEQAYVTLLTSLVVPPSRWEREDQRSRRLQGEIDAIKSKQEILAGNRQCLSRARSSTFLNSQKSCPAGSQLCSGAAGGIPALSMPSRR
jgi:hypothetical protein